MVGGQPWKLSTMTDEDAEDEHCVMCGTGVDTPEELQERLEDGDNA